LIQDVSANPCLLAVAFLARSGHSLLEVVVGAGEDAGEVGDPRPDVVLAFVPVSLGLVEARVIAVLRLEDALLDAHVARHAIPLGEQLVSGEEPGQTAVAVGDRVDGEEARINAPIRSSGCVRPSRLAAS